MEWKEVSLQIGKFAPILGAILGGPVGMTVTAAGALISGKLGVENTPSAVSEALKIDPQAALKLAQIESDEKIRLQEMLVDTVKAEMAAATQNAADINKTMQTEAGSEHWATYTWRPSIGFSVGFDLISSGIVVMTAYTGVMFFGVRPEVLSYIPAMLGAMAALVGVASPILGIASWHRGKMQINKTQVGNDNG